MPLWRPRSPRQLLQACETKQGVVVRQATHCVIHFVSLAVDELVQGGREVVKAEANNLQTFASVLPSNVGQVWSHLSTWATPACATLFGRGCAAMVWRQALRNMQWEVLELIFGIPAGSANTGQPETVATGQTW